MERHDVGSSCQEGLVWSLAAGGERIRIGTLAVDADLALALGLIGDGRHGETPSNLMKIYNFWLTAFGESGPVFETTSPPCECWVGEPGGEGVGGRGAIKIR